MEGAQHINKSSAILMINWQFFKQKCQKNVGSVAQIWQFVDFLCYNNNKNVSSLGFGLFDKTGQLKTNMRLICWEFIVF